MLALALGRKGQVAFEYLMVAAFALLLTVPLILVFFTQTDSFNRELAASQANKIASEVVKSAEKLYFLGEPSKTTIKVYMPRYVQEINVSETYITFVIGTSSQVFVEKPTVANLTGTIETFPGPHILELEAVGGQVVISEVK